MKHAAVLAAALGNKGEEGDLLGFEPRLHAIRTCPGCRPLRASSALENVPAAQTLLYIAISGEAERKRVVVAGVCIT